MKIKCPHCKNTIEIESPAATLGRIGGQSTSDAKKAAVRENGKRGGRPRINTWFVANYKGDLAGHDMSETRAKALALTMQEKEPDNEWEAIQGE